MPTTTGGLLLLPHSGYGAASLWKVTHRRSPPSTLTTSDSSDAQHVSSPALHLRRGPVLGSYAEEREVSALSQESAPQFG